MYIRFRAAVVTGSVTEGRALDYIAAHRFPHTKRAGEHLMLML